MYILSKTINSLTNFARLLGIAVLFLMMLFVFIAVIGRSLNHPILGDVEIVQFLMITVIMFSLSYTQSSDSHISIGLIVDRFPSRVQKISDIVGLVITIVICWIMGFIFFESTLKELSGVTIKSTLLNVPHFPFKFIIAFGLFLWGLQALLKLLQSFINFKKTEID